MTDTVSKHIIRYPNCRPSTIAYLRKRDETTDRLRQEITKSYQREAANRTQQRRWSLLSWLLGR